MDKRRLTCAWLPITTHWMLPARSELYKRWISLFTYPYVWKTLFTLQIQIKDGCFLSLIRVYFLLTAYLAQDLSIDTIYVFGMIFVFEFTTNLGKIYASTRFRVALVTSWNTSWQMIHTLEMSNNRVGMASTNLGYL